MIHADLNGQREGETRIVPAGCCEDCGGRCLLRAHVKGGVIVRIETDLDEGEPQLKACVRGRAYRQRLYSPDRLKYPMKRSGVRGEGKFERISWDEALDTVAGKLKLVKETYGPAAILVDGGLGISGQLHSWAAVARLFHMFGGCTLRWGTTSGQGSRTSSMLTYGTLMAGNSRDDLLNSRLIILWGWNPVETIWSTGTSLWIARAREAGIKVVAVDPRYTRSAAAFASQWIPIRPGTDAAMVIAMAYVIIREGLLNQKFLDTYSIGFDKFKDYVLGAEDNVPKTPAWAEKITEVPSATIEGLAREYATARPAALIPGYAPGRTAYGEQFHRAASALATMTGNVGVHGGYSAGHQPFPKQRKSTPRGIDNIETVFPPTTNPAEREPSPPSVDANIRARYRVHTTKVWDCIIGGKAGGYPSDIRMGYFSFSNTLNQRLNTNKAVEALKKLDFLVVHELFMTPTAKFADILLPVKMSPERTDIHQPWHFGAYFIFNNQAVDAPGECRSDFEICCELARRLGISGYSDKTEDEWLRENAKSYGAMAQEIADFAEFKRTGFHKVRLTGPVVAFKEQIEDPENNPFPTPSGKIEIQSPQLASLNDPLFPAVPRYIEPWESPGDPLSRKYPLQLITGHSLVRAHSTFANTPWLRELEPQAVLMNSEDARKRNIRDGDEVRVFNDRGQMIIPARLTERIMPGVVDVPQGAWYIPDKDGIDRGGCANVLTRDEYSPGGAFCSNTALVQVELAGKLKSG